MLRWARARTCTGCAACRVAPPELHAGSSTVPFAFQSVAHARLFVKSASVFLGAGACTRIPSRSCRQDRNTPFWMIVLEFEAASWHIAVGHDTGRCGAGVIAAIGIPISRDGPPTPHRQTRAAQFAGATVHKARRSACGWFRASADPRRVEQVTLVMRRSAGGNRLRWCATGFPRRRPPPLEHRRPTTRA
jgi:hypothetical protein